MLTPAYVLTTHPEFYFASTHEGTIGNTYSFDPRDQEHSNRGGFNSLC